MSLTIDKVLDLRGKGCPWVLLGCKAELAKLESGAVLKVLCTEPSARRDLSNFAHQTGNEMLFHGEENLPEQKAAVYYIRKKIMN